MSLFRPRAKGLAPGTDPALIWDRLAEIREAFALIVPSPGALDRAKAINLIDRVSFWDSVLYAACLEAGVKRLYSEDIPGSVIQGLEIISPFA